MSNAESNEILSHSVARTVNMKTLTKPYDFYSYMNFVFHRSMSFFIPF